MLVAAALYFFANTALVAAAVSFERGDRFTSVWRTHLAHLSMSFFGGAYVALLLTLLSPTLNVTGSILLIPMPLLLYAVFRSWNERVNDRIAFLDSSNRQYRASIGALAQAIDAKDQVTHGHIQRVQAMSLALARRLSAGDDALVEALEAASLLHDLGKIAIPEHILNKPGRLTDAEYARMKEHAAIGADILSSIEFPYPVVPIVRHHHENWDGGGYPAGLRGDVIPLGARILAVVDCFDALTSDRPYRPRMSTEEAFAILRERRGQMYDPAVVDAFIELQQALPSLEATRGSQPANVVRPPRAQPADASEPGLPALRRLDSHLFPGIGGPILQLACERLGASAGVLLGYDERQDTLRAAVAFGDVPGVMLAGIVMRGEGLSGWVAATRQSQLNADARLDFSGLSSGTDAHLRTAAAVAVARGPELLGVMTLYGPDPFSEAHLPLLEVLASAIARELAARPPAFDTPPGSPRALTESPAAG
jgi:putative nucleotidyltransferase with HDIG domain